MTPENFARPAPKPVPSAFENAPGDDSGSWRVSHSGSLPTPRGPGSRRALYVVAGLGVVALLAIGVTLALRTGNAYPVKSGRNDLGIPVNTVKPKKKDLKRTLEQPGSIKAWAQAELYAKAAGYLKFIQRDLTPPLIAELVLQPLTGTGPAIATGASILTVAELGMIYAPEKNIGSHVAAGEMLLELSVPERFQEIVEKETFVRQREAELAAARTTLATHKAAEKAAEAHEKQAEADVRKFHSEHAFRAKELKRLKELVQSRTIPQEIADEKEHQVNAALAGWESSLAKVQTAKAELAVVSSKLAVARTDIKVKEELVQIARDGLRLAGVLADYSRVSAPFDGVITYRGVDEGDFVQNATSGQSRRLMTVAAIDKVRVVVQVPDRDASWVHVGTPAAVVVHSRRFVGSVIRTARALDPQTRTMQAEIDLDNRDHQLLPEDYGTVTLTLQTIKDAQVIPASAIASRKGQNFIIQVHNGVARRQLVRIRYDDGKEVEVVKIIGNREVPLDGTEELVISNKGEIADGQRVKASLLVSSLFVPARDRSHRTLCASILPVGPGRRFAWNPLTVA